MHILRVWLSQAAAQLIKMTLDKKFGATWHCVIGEGMAHFIFLLVDHVCLSNNM